MTDQPPEAEAGLPTGIKPDSTEREIEFSARYKHGRGVASSGGIRRDSRERDLAELYRTASKQA